MSVLGSSRENIRALQASSDDFVFGIVFAHLAYRLPNRTTALFGGQPRLTMRSAQQAAHPRKIESISSKNVDKSSHSTIGGRAGMLKIRPRLGGGVTKIASPGDLLDPPPGEIR